MTRRRSKRRRYTLRDLLALVPPLPWRLLKIAAHVWVMAVMIVFFVFLVVAGLAVAVRL